MKKSSNFIIPSLLLWAMSIFILYRDLTKWWLSIILIFCGFWPIILQYAIRRASETKEKPIITFQVKLVDNTTQDDFLRLYNGDLTVPELKNAISQGLKIYIFTLAQEKKCVGYCLSSFAHSGNAIIDKLFGNNLYEHDCVFIYEIYFENPYNQIQKRRFWYLLESFLIDQSSTYPPRHLFYTAKEIDKEIINLGDFDKYIARDDYIIYRREIKKTK